MWPCVGASSRNFSLVSISFRPGGKTEKRRKRERWREEWHELRLSCCATYFFSSDQARSGAFSSASRRGGTTWCFDEAREFTFSPPLFPPPPLLLSLSFSKKDWLPFEISVCLVPPLATASCHVIEGINEGEGDGPFWVSGQCVDRYRALRCFVWSKKST